MKFLTKINPIKFCLAISTIFLLSSVFYVPLFHYLPFLPNRTADRGIFNFFLMTIIWIVFLRFDIKDEIDTERPKNKN